MKRNLILRNASVVLTLLTVVSLASCRDQNFDWDEARATEQYQKFTNVFVKEFGKPAEGHQWGFDLADLSMGGDLEAQTRAVYKQDEPMPGHQNQQVKDCIPLPLNISKREHDEVSAWFRHHRVRWAETPTYYGKGQSVITKDYNTRSTVNNDNTAYFDLNGALLPDGYSSIEDLKNNNPYAYQSFLRNTLGFGSLVDYSDRNVLGNYRMNANISYSNVWVQHVAADRTYDEYADNGQTYNCQNMNQLKCWVQGAEDLNYSEPQKLYDWNGGKGYGYDEDKNNGEQTQWNGTLITDANVNNWSYECSASSSTDHDKYYIVYLKGEGYEGYYLGFDFEADRDWANPNERVPANGICNDWIIKISSVGSVTNYNPARIMCEDLGGNAKITGSDIDYNDVVIDVEYEEKGNGQIKDNGCVVTLVLQAAGGTIPACVSYDDIPLFEVHELFNDVYGKHLTNDEYKIMYNTKGGKSPSGGIMAERPAKTFKLFINTNNGYTGARNEKYITDSGKFSIDRLKIKVYRNGVDDYLNQSVNTFNEAEWINLNNREGEAPLKICVPKYYNGEEVMWPQEKVKITLGYENFSAWVADPTKPFWDKNVYSVKPEYLYGSKFSGVTEEEKNPNEGQESEDFTEPVQPSEPEQPEEPETPTDPDTPGTDEDADEIVLWEGNQEFTNWLWKAMKEPIPILQANSPTASSKILYYIIINNPSVWAFNVTGVSIGPWNSPSDISVVEGDFDENMLNIYGNGIYVQGNNITLTKITLKK